MRTPTAPPLPELVAAAIEVAEEFRRVQGVEIRPLAEAEVEEFLADILFGRKAIWECFTMRLITREELRNRILFEFGEFLRTRQTIARLPIDPLCQASVASTIDRVLDAALE